MLEGLRDNIAAWFYYTQFDQGRAWIAFVRSDGSEASTRKFVRLYLDGDVVRCRRSGGEDIPVRAAGIYNVAICGSPAGPPVDVVPAQMILACPGVIHLTYDTISWRFR